METTLEKISMQEKLLKMVVSIEEHDGTIAIQRTRMMIAQELALEVYPKMKILSGFGTSE